MQPAISVSNLGVTYRAKKGESLNAVRDLSFSVSRGEIVGFLGPNGAGKSSTLKALMGFVEPDSGTLEIFGETAGTPESRTQIGYLPEVAMYYPFLTPIETLTMYGELQGLSGKSLRKEIDDLLDLVGIGHAKNKLNRSMSKGMLQRVGIAQSLLGNPRLLILDEVTSGLDPVGRKELRNLLKAKRDQGATLFFSSHELAEVDMLCDRLILIHKGQLVEERTMTTLKDELREYRLTYRGSANVSDIAREMNTGADGVTLASFANAEAILAATERIRAKGGTILDIVSQEGSLEEYFVHTIQEAA